MSSNNVYLMNQKYVNLFEDFMKKVNELPSVKIYIDAIHSDTDNKAVYHQGVRANKSDTLQIDITSGNSHTLYAFQMPQSRLLDSKNAGNSPLRFKDVSVVKSNLDGPIEKSPISKLETKFMRYSTQAINSLTRDDDGYNMLLEMLPESPEDEFGMYDGLKTKFDKLYEALESADVAARKVDPSRADKGVTVDLSKHMEVVANGDIQLLSGMYSSLNLLSVYGRCKGLAYAMPGMADYAVKGQVVVSEDTALNITDGGLKFIEKQDRNAQMSNYYSAMAGCTCCYPKLLFRATNDADNKPKITDEYRIFRSKTNTKTPYARIIESPDGNGFKIKYKGMLIGIDEFCKENTKQPEKLAAIGELIDGFPFISQLRESQFNKLITTEFANISKKGEVSPEYGIDMLAIDLKTYHQVKDGKLKGASANLENFVTSARVSASNYDLAQREAIVNDVHAYTPKSEQNGVEVVLQDASRAVASQSGMYATIKGRVLGTVDMVKMGSLVEDVVESNGGLSHVQGAVKADSTYRTQDSARALEIRKNDQVLSYLIGSELSEDASENTKKVEQVIQTSDEFSGYRSLSRNWNKYAIAFNDAVSNAEQSTSKESVQTAIKAFMKLNDFTTMVDVYDMKTEAEFETLSKDIDSLYGSGDKNGIGSLYRPQNNYEIDVIRTIIKGDPTLDKSLFTIQADSEGKPESFLQMIDKVIPEMNKDSRKALIVKCEDIGKIADTFEVHEWADLADRIEAVDKPSGTQRQTTKQVSSNIGYDITDSI